MRSVQEIQQAVANLEYDFTRFRLLDFISHLAGFIRRPIETKAFHFSPGLFGFWIPTPNVHYIGYGDNLHSTHKVHTVLHELGHIVLRHKPKPIDEVLPRELSTLLSDESLLGLPRLAEDWRDDPQEIECERFAFVIQQQLVKVRRLKELTGKSSFEALDRYIEAMGYRE